MDYIYALDRLPVGDGKYLAQSRTESAGGMAACAAVAIDRLGGKAFFYGRLGADAIGEEILEGLRQEGVDVTGVRCYAGRVSPHSIVLVDKTGERIIVPYGAEAFPVDPSWLPLTEIAAADAVLADIRWPEAAEVVFRQARMAGKPAVLDAEASSNPAAMLAVQSASHALFSASGLEALSGTTSVEDGLNWAWEHNRAWVGVTLGAQGIVWLEDGRLEQLSAIPVEAVETLGAGDVFHGAFVLALGEGQTNREAVRFASAVAALKCSRSGGRKSYPSRAEVLQFMKQHRVAYPPLT